MRLITLQLTAVGPYAHRHRIDFDDFAASGLFLLSGPTGAGKSTLLDAIVFALYGASDTGVDSASKERLHCQAAPDTTPEVELVFEVDSGIYRIIRSPQFERVKKRGSGTTTVNSTCVLHRAVGEDLDDPLTWEPVATQVAEANREIRSIIGFSRVQFTQTMMLPQGAFAEFLTAAPEDRTEILRELCGTHVYLRVQNYLAEQARSATAATDKAEAAALQELGNALRQACTVPEQLYRETVPFLPVRMAVPKELTSTDMGPESPWPGRLQTQISARADLAAELRRLLGEAEQQEKDAAGHVQAGRDVAKLQQEYAAARERAEMLDREKSEITALEARLGEQVDAVSVSGKAKELQEAALALTTALTATGVDARGGQATDIDKPSAGDAARESLDAGDSSWHAEAGADALLQWEGTGAIREALETELARYTAQTEALTKQQARAEQIDERARDVRKERKRAEKLRLTAAEHHQTAEKYQRIIEQTPARLTELGQKMKAAQAIADTTEECRSRLAGCEQRQQAATEAAQLAELWQAQQRKVQQAVATAQTAKEEYDRRHRQWLANAAGVVAASLEPGEPCPACGSTDHPHPAAGASDEGDAAAVEAANTALQQANTALAAAQSQEENLRARQQEAAEKSGKITVEAAQQAVTEAQGALGQAQAAAREVTETEKEHATLQRDYTHATENCERERAMAATLSEQAEQAEEQAEQWQAAVTKELGDFATTTALLKSVRAELGAAEAAATAGRTALNRLDQLGEQRQKTAAALQASRYSSCAQAASVVMSDHEREAAQATVQTYRKNRAEVDAIVGNADYRAAAAQPAPDLAVLTTRWEQAEQRVKEYVSLSAVAERSSSELSEARERYEKAYARWATYQDKHRDVIALAAMVTGKNNSGVTLDTYAVLALFDDVLHVANEHLQKISSGRYELRQSQEKESGRQHKRGLAIHIYDHFNEAARPLKSLSGGETFYTALSLALGLATTVRAQAGGIEMKTLFIDEGFGSLDPETLDQVMQILHQLHHDGTLVGVVSHVEEMKRQIADRIDVRKLPGGTSTFRCCVG
ncbi:MAG: SMC family ATPase [Bowdeniella nasicola]|nr:SMC family ATPase [Bowdeniella nasicola]